MVGVIRPAPFVDAALSQNITDHRPDRLMGITATVDNVKDGYYIADDRFDLVGYCNHRRCSLDRGIFLFSLIIATSFLRLAIFCLIVSSTSLPPLFSSSHFATAKGTAQVVAILISQIREKIYPTSGASGQLNPRLRYCLYCLSQLCIVGQAHRISVTFTIPICRSIKKNDGPAYQKGSV